MIRLVPFVCLTLCVLACDAPAANAIDRHALVARHSPTITAIDPASPFMVGNGNFAFTADITGLQTFQDQYSALVPLMTQAQWAWHRFPGRYTLEDGLVPVQVRGRTRHYAWLRDWSEASNPAIAWLRQNPHRFSLGRLGLHLRDAGGQPARFSDLSGTQQTLDLWSGTLRSRFSFAGEPVQVETRVHPELDMLMVTLRSSLLEQGRLGLELKFPGIARQLNPDPADWTAIAAHHTSELARDSRTLRIERRIDGTRYFVTARSDRDVEVTTSAPHRFHISPLEPVESLTLLVLFCEQADATIPDIDAALAAAPAHWQHYWRSGAMIDFSGSTDPRAYELERRIVLSQYLMAVNAAGELPPQEEGLFSNSWNGKFHVEMHLWHAAHFAIWGHTDLLERSMGWYLKHLPEARRRASAQGVRGAWWPKMVGPEGRESPSTINPFLMWQQPHPIFLAELIYRDRATAETLQRYRDIVLESADLLASFVHFDRKRNQYVLGPPIIPAQEVFPPLTTFNPTFELEYYRFGLHTAQRWRERLGLPRKRAWDRVLAQLAPLPQKDGLYLATESFPQLWEQARSPQCSRGKTAAQCWNRDHPSFLGALGLLPGLSVDREVMRRTLAAVQQHWDLRQTWGWDFPLMAMTAARLGQPDQAIDYLLYPAKNNNFGLAGMAPRVHLDEHAQHFVPTAGAHADGPGYRRAAETYFPSNGALLLAVGLMAAGWEGHEEALPGFPKDGSWKVRAEGLRKMP